MLTDIRLWKKYPILLLIRLAQNTIRTTALLFFILVISLMTTSQAVADLPVGFIAISLGLNWILMLYFGAKLGRYKIMLYPLMFVLNPFFNWLYMVYGIFTCGQRTWGGPRADAGKADEKVSPEQAIAEAEAKGDDLNVVPETFKPAVELARRKSGRQTPLMPSSRLEGRFAPAEQLPGGWYNQLNDSSGLRADMTPRDGDEELVIYHKGPRRDSTDSFTTSHASVTLPRRLESFFGLEDLRQYYAQLDEQRPAGGAFLEAAIEQEPEQTAPAFGNGPIPPRQEPSVGSLRSVESDSSISMHFRVPARRPQMPPANGSQAPIQPPTVRQPTRPTDHDPVPSRPTLTVPAAVHQSSAARTGLSPLARKSYTRLATDDAPSTAGTSTEVEVRVPRSASTDDDEAPRGRVRRVSVGADGRRRLSKQPRGSRSSSRA